MALLRATAKATGNMTVRFAPAYSSQSSGSIERFHRTLTGHIRTLRTQVQQNSNTRLPTTHPIMACAVRHSAYLINRFLIRADGYTSYHKRCGRTHNAALCEFGETVMYMVQSIKQRPKLEPRFYKGIWLGKCTSTGESFIGIAGRIVRSRTIRRLAGTNRYDDQLMDTITGTPWNPNQSDSSQLSYYHQHQHQQSNKSRQDKYHKKKRVQAINQQQQQSMLPTQRKQKQKQRKQEQRQQRNTSRRTRAKHSFSINVNTLYSNEVGNITNANRFTNQTSGRPST